MKALEDSGCEKRRSVQGAQQNLIEHRAVAVDEVHLKASLPVG